MELDLLRTLLMRCSELLAALVDGVLDDPGPAGEKARDSLQEVSRQNAVIRARVETRKEDTESQLNELFRRTQRQKAYDK
jgi:hypothetical protein